MEKEEDRQEFEKKLEEVADSIINIAKERQAEK